MCLIMFTSQETEPLVISRGPLGNLKTTLVANISIYDLFGESKVSKIVRV